MFFLALKEDYITIEAFAVMIKQVVILLKLQLKVNCVLQVVHSYK